MIDEWKYPEKENVKSRHPDMHTFADGHAQQAFILLLK